MGPVRKPRFGCDFAGCNKTFSRSDHLKRHQLNHTEGAKLHECSVCHKTFRRSDVMVEHYQRHFKVRTGPHAAALDPLGIGMDLLWPPAAAPVDRPDGVGTPDLMQLLVNENYPNAALMELFQSNFDTAVSGNSSVVTAEMVRGYVMMVPGLVLMPDFSVPALQYCLEVYWLIFHIQFPILHRPSFNTLTARPELLLAMIMVGAVLSVSVDAPAAGPPPLLAPWQLALEIGRDLRWMVFRHRQHGSSEPWELQTLLILEVYEKHYANRDLHERSSIHHAAKIEMMKRSTVLGGDPLAAESRSATDLPASKPSSDSLLTKWVTAESMKRCALMAFCFDLTNTVISSHNSSLYVDKLKLALPCDDIIWESDLDTLKSLPLPQQPDMIRTCFKKLLKGDPVETSSFGKRVLFHALVSCIIQLENKDDISALLSELNVDMLSDSWRAKLSYALDIWKYNINSGTCCNADNILIDVSVRQSTKCNPRYLALNDTKCKLPIYHMAHIRLHVINHDMLIYAGVPLRMNVTALSQDFHNVSWRIARWADSTNGRMGVVHAYMCLFECLLSDEVADDYDYAPEKDPIPERNHIVVALILIIWCYGFRSKGVESNTYYSENPNQCKEPGLDYLRRVKREFDANIVTAEGSLKFYQSVSKFAQSLLPEIKDINHIAGFMGDMAKMYQRCFWTLGKEYSKLFEGCKQRCLGKKRVFCDNMYSEE